MGADDSELTRRTIGSRENHPLRLDTTELACREVSDEAHLLAYQLLRSIVLGDTGDDGATAQPVIDTELKELVCLGYLRAFGDRPHTDIELEEVVKGDVFGDGSGVVFGCCVGFLRASGSVLR